MGLDTVAGTVVTVVVLAGFRVVGLVLPGTGAALGGRVGGVVTLVTALVVAVLVVAVLPSVPARGATLGETAVWLVPGWPRVLDRSPVGDRTRRVTRALVVPGPLVLALAASRVWSEHAEWVQLPGLAWVALALVMVPVTSTHRSLSGVLTGAEFTDARSPVVAVAGGATQS